MMAVDTSVWIDLVGQGDADLTDVLKWHQA